MKFLEVVNTDIPTAIDDHNFERLSKFKWYAQGEYKHIVRYAGKKGSKQKWIALSNEVLQIYGITLDHKDRNTFNNLEDNLRPCTQTQNMMNTRKRNGCSSLYKGVCWDKAYKKWRAKISIKGKQIYLGLFKLEKEAGSAYNKAAKILFKEFAVLNRDENNKILEFLVEIPELKTSQN